jgi:UDP-GlcNAc3NAcA epimerase
MSGVFFDELGIAPPHINLDIHGGNHGEMTGRMLAGIEQAILAEKPDMVLVPGDTNSTLAGALAAAKLLVPVAHLEAGLRSFNRAMPEETNRVLADHVSALLLCPTDTAIANLRHEGITTGVHDIGDVMYDATLFAAAQANSSPVLEKLGLAGQAYAIATVHRAENTDSAENLARVIGYLRDQAARHDVVLPVHPRTRQAIARWGIELGPIRVCEPLGYLDMHRLLQSAAAVYTDSGGVQKEAYFHRVPCVTLRDETEWVETVTCGWNRLWRGPDYAPRRDIAAYGDGRAADRAVELIVAHLACQAKAGSRPSS